MSNPNTPYELPRVVNVIVSDDAPPRVVIEFPDWHDREYALTAALRRESLTAAMVGKRVCLSADGWARLTAAMRRPDGLAPSDRIADLLTELVDRVAPRGAGRRPMPWAHVVRDGHEPRVIVETGHLDRKAREVIVIATERAGHSGCRVDNGFCLTRQAWARVCDGMAGQYGNRSSTSEEALMASNVMRVVDAALTE